MCLAKQVAHTMGDRIWPHNLIPLRMRGGRTRVGLTVGGQRASLQLFVDLLVRRAVFRWSEQLDLRAHWRVIVAMVRLRYWLHYQSGFEFGQ